MLAGVLATLLSALAAGGFIMTAAVYIFRLERLHAVVRPAVLTAFLGYSAVAVGLLFDLGLHAADFRRHDVERGRQVAQFIVRPHRQAVFPISSRHAVRAVDEFLHRAVNHHPHEAHSHRAAECEGP